MKQIPRLRRALLAGTVALCLAAATAGCGGAPSSSTSNSAAPVAPSAANAPETAEGHASTITIDDYAFTPAVLTVKLGTAVMVVNHDSVEHTVSASDKSFDTGPLSAGQSTTFTTTKVGTFAYVCSIHPYMTGTITVTP